MAAFDVTTRPTSLSLKPGTTGSIMVVVSNRLGEPVMGLVEGILTPASAAKWLVPPPPDQAQRRYEADPAATVNLEFKVAVPNDAAAQQVHFKARARDVMSPDDTTVDGQTVAIEVLRRDSVVSRKRLPWWVWAIAALVVLGAGFAVYMIVRPKAFIVTGRIVNNQPLPPNARLLVAWSADSGQGDYTYVFGEGTLNASTGTFRIRLDQPPPSQALFKGTFGVGTIIVTTNRSIATGGDIMEVPETELIGAAGRHAIIWKAEQATPFPGWPSLFDKGYGVGVGVDVTRGFDRFEPTNSSSVVLIIDDLRNIDFVNWT